MVCGGAASAPSEEGAGAPKGFRGATEGEITRACCLLRGADEHGAKKRSFAFSLVYIKCFRTYSAYLSLRLPAQILYAGIHLCPSPPAARASAIRSRTCGRQRLAFLAVSATGGARKPNPSEGGEGAPAPYTEFAKVPTAVKPAEAGCPHPARCGTVPHRATFPKGKAKRSRAVRRFSCSGKA